MLRRIAFNWGYFAVYLGREGSSGRWRYLHFAPILLSLVAWVGLGLAIIAAGFLFHFGWNLVAR